MKFSADAYNELFHPIPDTVAQKVTAHVEVPKAEEEPEKKPQKKSRKKTAKKEPEKKVEEVEEVEKEPEEEPEATGGEEAEEVE